MTAQPSGRDLARKLLAETRAAMARREGPMQRKPIRRVASVPRGADREPVGLGGVLSQLNVAYEWNIALAGGGITDRWAEIAPELAQHVAVDGFDPEQGVLRLRPVSPAYATKLRWGQADVVRRVNAAMGREVVRAVKVLSPGGEVGANAVCTPAPEPDGYTAVYPAPPTGAPPTAEMLAWRQHHAAERAERDTTPDYGTQPQFRDAYGRLREDPAAFTDAIAAMEAAGELPVDDAERRARENEARHKAALAVARTTARAGDPQPIRDTTAA